MTPDEIKALLIIQVRRRIIDALNHAYGIQPLGGAALLYVFADVDEGFLRKDIHYFIQAGLVQRVNAVPNQAFKDQEFELTHKGKDEADRITRFPGLNPEWLTNRHN